MKTERFILIYNFSHNIKQASKPLDSNKKSLFLLIPPKHSFLWRILSVN